MNNFKIKYNNAFNELNWIENIQNNGNVISGKLLKILDEGFNEDDGCYFFSRFTPAGPLSPDLSDKTGNEAFYNKILIDDFSSHEDNRYHIYLYEGVAFAFLLAKNLNHSKRNF